MRALLRRLLSPVVELREREATTALMMFSYSFLVMASYTALKPVTRSQFISDLGADNLPWVQFASGVLIGFIMQGYGSAVARLPRRWALPITLGALVVLLVGFWVWFQTGSDLASTGFYFFGLILGILVISQFWTLANVVYDPRQAKRVFGFIGGGASLGGVAGSSLTLQAPIIGTTNLLLVSAALMAVCVVLVTGIIKRENPELQGALVAVEEEKGVSGGEAFRLLLGSRHLQTISLIIAFAAIGAAIVEQQLNMAAEAAVGQNDTDAITSLLGQVQLYTSAIGFVIQVWLTSKIQRYLGIGFALLILPASLGITGTIILLNGVLWAPALARVIDTSLRYTIDKTSREILFLPLPNDLKQQAKPVVDVTVDRFAKGLGALLVLVLIKDWGLGLTWQQLSWASLAMISLWVIAAVRARREYRAVFRRTLERQDVAPEALRLTEADLSTIEALVEELGHSEPRHVLYAIDMLESLDKRHLVSPLLLNHDAPKVRARALSVVEGASPELRERWRTGVERLLKDNEPEVRAAAVRALAVVRGAQAAEIMRPHLDDRDPRMAVTAATALATSPDPADRQLAQATLERLAGDAGPNGAAGRREVARALGTIPGGTLNRLLVPLLYDAQRDVALEAIRSAGRVGFDPLLLPPLVARLRERLLKAAARDVLVGYGDDVLDALAYFLRDQDEDIWVRRHIPATLARIPNQRSMDILIATLSEKDGFLRFKVVNAILQLRQAAPSLTLQTEPVEQLLVRESNRYLEYLSLRYNLVRGDADAADTLLARALQEKLGRTLDRIYRLLGLVYPWRDIQAARWSLENGDSRMKAGAAEYLDNLLSGPLRKRVMPVLEDLPLEEKVRRGNLLLKTRIRDAEDSLAQLVHEEDQIVAAAAMHLVEQRGLWGLADDLEYALEHRDARDWYVFEAASWALAARRLSPEQRRLRWLEPLPAVQIADRLSRLPLFRFTSVDELFRIAGTGRQLRHEPGRILLETGARPPDLQFLLDGTVEQYASGDMRQTQTVVAAPAALDFEDLFEGVPARHTVKASTIAVCLSLLNEQYLSLVSENAELALGLFRMLLEARGDAAVQRLVVRGAVRPPSADRLRDGLQPIELLLLLAEMPLLSRASADQLAAVAAVAREVPLTEGGVLFREGDQPSIYIVLEGELALEPAQGGEPISVGAGDSVGVYETLGGLDATGWRAHVTRRGVALRIEGEALVEVVADRVDLLQGLFSALRRLETKIVAV